ncbi:uncharacterized protein LOC116850000 [Odontomachus brunneus]|uniref:uncharacterized protein LOC116850000 n=1 Tax=Odontomachus brunneus TaxID=486640 RepID=UPI0013F23EBD|nr:uncharacterized protein LOC116850000 [Odontomachus brunneus]
MGKLTQIERELWERSTRLNSRDEYDAWMQKCDECIESLEEHSRVKRLITDQCRHYFDSNEKLESHTTNCQKLNNCAITLPTEDNKLAQLQQEGANPICSVRLSGVYAGEDRKEREGSQIAHVSALQESKDTASKMADRYSGNCNR